MKLNLKIPKFKKEKKIKKDMSIIDPNIYWRVIIYFALFLIFSSFVFGFYLFRQVSSEPELPTSNKNNKVEKIQKERIDAVLQYFLDKEQNSLELLDSEERIPDPSSVNYKEIEEQKTEE